jgi:hypothetical protein
MEQRHLAIYLNDHLAGATAGVALAERCRKSNNSGELGVFLRGLVSEIADDRTTLVQLMERLSVPQSKPKIVLASLGEKLARLKLNGRLVRYSPLSRFVELEALSIGIEGKRCLWVGLAPVAAVDQRLRDFDLAELAERARSQRGRLEPHRLEAAERAFVRFASV